MFLPLADRWLPRVGIGKSRALPDRLAAWFGLDGERLAVPIAKCAAYRTTGFGRGGNSHHQKACSIYIETGSEDAVREFLRGEIQASEPSSLAEMLFGSNDPSLRPLTELSSLHRFLPWERKIRTTSGLVAQGEHTFNSVSEEKLEAETRRFTGLVDSIREFGYRPERFPSGHVRGYFLLRGDDFRFVVMEGTHRIGAVSALGVEQLPVRLARKGPVSVDVADLESWPHVRSGYCSRELAMMMVQRYFADGTERAQWPQAS